MRCLVQTTVLLLVSQTLGSAIPLRATNRTVSVPQQAPLGVRIVSCLSPGVLALTFDDGSNANVDAVLDILERHDAPATFFVLGEMVDTDVGGAALRRMLDAGHQVASHTYHHQDLDSMSWDQRAKTMERTDQAIARAFGNGRAPTYMRPPYGNCDDSCVSQMAELGYRVVTWNVDTNDWRFKEDYESSRAMFDEGIAGGPESGKNPIVLAHDIHRSTVEYLAEYMIIRAREMGFELMTVGECWQEDPEEWYRDV